MMSLTTDMKEELVTQKNDLLVLRKAETASILRFSGGLHLVSGRIVIEAEVDRPSVAQRLQKNLFEIYGARSETVIVSGGGIRRGDRFVVRVVKDADKLARLTGLIDRYGRPVRGLAPRLVSAGQAELVALWRGAFLARGTLVEPGRSCSLEITCPGPEAALALVGAARKVGVSAKSREVRGYDRVVVRDGDMIATLLEKMGAKETLALWLSRRERREMRGSANRLANFDDANLRRSARAAVAASARVARAFEILGPEIPDHLEDAGRLRLAFRQASLEELGQKADPPLTKDAVAGRIRRLLAMADKKAHEMGIGDTESVLTADLLDQ